MKLTRRSFLKVLGASAATIAAPQVLAEQAKETIYYPTSDNTTISSKGTFSLDLAQVKAEGSTIEYDPVLNYPYIK